MTRSEAACFIFRFTLSYFLTFSSQNDLLEMLEAEDDFNDILGLVQQTRSAGQGMSDEQRRANAERVISAISNMLGSDLLLDDE